MISSFHPWIHWKFPLECFSIFLRIFPHFFWISCKNIMEFSHGFFKESIQKLYRSNSSRNSTKPRVFFKNVSPMILLGIFLKFIEIFFQEFFHAYLQDFYTNWSFFFQIPVETGLLQSFQQGISSEELPWISWEIPLEISSKEPSTVPTVIIPSIPSWEIPSAFPAKKSTGISLWTASIKLNPHHNTVWPLESSLFRRNSSDLRCVSCRCVNA